MKKKIIAISLITVMVVCNSMVAWAANPIVTDGGQDTANVNATYVVGSGITDSDGDGVPDVDVDGVPGKDTTLDGDNDGEVETPTGAAYSVDIAWGDMNFKYNAGATTWDDENHVYKETSDGTWVPAVTDPVESASNKIQVTNNSNVGIYGTVTYANEGGIYGGVAGTLCNGVSSRTQVVTPLSIKGTNVNTDNTFTLPNAVKNTDDALVATNYLQLSGKPTNSWVDSKKIGTVTLTINYYIN